MIEEIKRRLLNLLLALDRLGYVLITLGNGSDDEYMSTAAYRIEQEGKIGGRIARPVIDWIFSPWEREHCRQAYERMTR